MEPRGGPVDSDTYYSCPWGRARAVSSAKDAALLKLAGKDEKNLSTQQSAAEENARFHGPNGHPGRTPSVEAPESQGAQAPDSVDSSQTARITPTQRRRFGAAHRFHRRADFLRIRRAGLSSRSPHFVLYVDKVCRPGPNRLGITASRQIGIAVVRNRLRRRIREYFRLDLSPRLPGVDVLVVARPGAGELTMALIGAELGAAMASLHPRIGK